VNARGTIPAVRRILVPLLVAVVLAARAGASVAVRASVEDLTEASRGVVEGVVTEHSVTLDRAAGVIWTEHRLRVGRVLAGDKAETIVVRVRGGSVGTIVQEVIGAPKLEDGERVVLFLGPEEHGGHEIVGMAQGAFEVETDPKTGATLCHNSTDGLSLVDAAGADAPPEALRLSLADLTSRVAAAREKIDARRRAARDALDRKLAAWRRAAERHMEMTRGKPGGAAL
jgi:hypothetical protein